MQSLLRKALVISLLSVIIVIFVAAAGGKKYAEDPEFFAPLSDIYEHIRNYFYWTDRIDAEQAAYGAMKGMVEALDDPYSEFLDPEDRKQWEESLEGEFSGVGIEITIKDSVLTVIAPLAGTPAQQAGVRAGDLILEIDGESTEGITLTQAALKIRGEIGTSVVLHVRHKDETEEDIEIIRDIIVVEAATSELIADDTIGYIQISRFNNDVTLELDRALVGLDLENLDGLIVDLRNNPGGYMDEAVRVASRFIDEGVIMIRDGRTTNNERYWSSGNVIPNLPLALLINTGSASASEIVAGAIRDHNMGILIGQTSFGKGVIQQVFDFPGGAALKLTVGEYFTPDGDVVHEVGLTPDIEVNDDGDPLEVAIDWIKDHVGETMPIPIASSVKK